MSIARSLQPTFRFHTSTYVVILHSPIPFSFPTLILYSYNTTRFYYIRSFTMEGIDVKDDEKRLERPEDADPMDERHSLDDEVPIIEPISKKRKTIEGTSSIEQKENSNMNHVWEETLSAVQEDLTRLTVIVDSLPETLEEDLYDSFPFSCPFSIAITSFPCIWTIYSFVCH
jgi:hypothetical protein